MVDKQKRLWEAFRKQKECMMIWMKEVTWDMVGPRVLKTVEVKSMVVELVSNAVDRAEKQRRLFKAGRKQEKHLVMEVVNQEVEQMMERLKAERLKRSEEKRSRYWRMELEETRENFTTNLQSLLENFYTKFKYKDQEEENGMRLLRKRKVNGKPKYKRKFKEVGDWELPMEVDRKVWRKVRRRLVDPTEGDLSRGGGSSSSPLSCQPTN